MGQIILHGAAKVTAATGALVANSGWLTSCAHTGAGDHLLNIDPDYAINAAECVILVQASVPMVLSAFTTFGVLHTSDVAKQVTCVQEQGGGAASISTDVDFEVLCFRIVP